MSDATPMTFVADIDQLPPAATGAIVYRSTGHCLIVGPLDRAMAALALMPELKCTIVSVDAGSQTTEKRLLDSGAAVFTTPSLAVTGHLGAFTASAGAGDEAQDLGVAVWLEEGQFDLMLDVGDVPVFSQSLPPFGYSHVGEADPAEACAALQELVGEFDKPRYFDYKASLCAHSRSNLSGCTRCIDVCATDAIRSAGEGISVDPYLCQGCGSCATLCPTGAMRYAYPPLADAVARTRQQHSDGVDTVVLHTVADEAAISAADLPDSVLALAVEEISAFGLDYWLTTLSGGVGRILLVTDASDNDVNRQALVEQAALMEQLLAGLGDDAARSPVLHLVGTQELADSVTSTVADPDFASATPATHTVHDDKRANIRAALDALAERVSPREATVALGQGAPFGRIRVDTNACTLCMACVSTCPAGSLLDGQDTPALRQIEANCVQCGLCEAACPENAITLEARYRWDSVEARRTETLHEEAPFHCVKCHKAFATQKMIATMTEKLAGHWMFKDEKAVRRLKMCEDCRVKDMFESDAKGIDVHKEGAST